MRVLVAMSGGVDSAVAALRMVEEGHEVVGATLKLWGGPSDSGCCSLADVTDARRVADRLGVEHHVFNLTDSFEDHVVRPYVAAHAAARTPNPCVECNRHIKFAALLAKATRLGFDALATGHHARVVRVPGGAVELRRGADAAKDQSYVLSVLGPAQLDKVLFPVGELDKSAVRDLARAHGLGVADKRDSQEVCFVASRGPGAGRRAFLAERIALTAAVVRDTAGERLGEVDALELVTVGQRRGLRIPGGEARYVVAVDARAREILVGSPADLLASRLALEERTWCGEPFADGTEVLVQTSAHGPAVPGVLVEAGVAFDASTRRVAPGQIVALYRGDVVLGSGIAA